MLLYQVNICDSCELLSGNKIITRHIIRSDNRVFMRQRLSSQRRVLLAIKVHLTPAILHYIIFQVSLFLLFLLLIITLNMNRSTIRSICYLLCLLLSLRCCISFFLNVALRLFNHDCLTSDRDSLITGLDFLNFQPVVWDLVLA